MRASVAQAWETFAPTRRETVNLDGIWRFRFEDGPWRDARVPAPWAAVFDDLRNRSGIATYERELDIPSHWADLEVLLHFGAVNYFCEVSLNGERVGSHEGGYLPFEVVLPARLLNGRNLLSVRVVQPSADNERFPDFPFAEIPHGKQSWYGPLGGIWQSVHLEARDPRNLRHVTIVPDYDAGTVNIEAEITQEAAGLELRADIFGPDGAIVLSTSEAAGNGRAKLRVKIPGRKPWSPDAPNLYTARLKLGDETGEVDLVEKTFGFRKIETRQGQLYLNDEPLYIRGALDQDYYPDGISTPPSLEFLEDQFRKAKQLGLNLLRCHIKIPDPRYYEVADRLGMLIWTEIPNVAHLSERAEKRMRETMEGILRRDGHHPSIIIWTIINEDWGTRLAENAHHRNWLKAEFDWLKSADPTRLVVDNSPCHGNFHLKTDINDFHYYRSVPERRAEWDKLTSEFAQAADWTFSPHGDAVRKGDEPLIVSEFGVWGLPDPKLSIHDDGSEPGWFESGPGWGDGAAYPHGIQSRFDAYHLDRPFGSFDEFIQAVQWYQFENLKYQIESMRAHETIQGYVVTEFTDVHWEANGLLDLNRNPRIFHERFASIAGDIVIVAQPEKFAGYSGEQLEIDLKLASGSKQIGAGMLAVTLDGKPFVKRGTSEVGALSVATLDAIDLTLPDAATARQIDVKFSLEVDGETVSQNGLTLAVYPRQTDKMGPRLHAADARLADHLAGLGYQLVARDQADIVVVHALDAEDIAILNDGARYVVLADGSLPAHRNLRKDAPVREQPFMPIVDDVPGLPRGPESQSPNIVLHDRHGTIWRGDWIANFSWVTRQGPFAQLAGGPLVDLSFEHVIPRHVMTGFRPWEYEGLVHGALAVGWLHKPAVTIGERAVGKGRLVATTFRLLGNAPGIDPVADTLLDAVIAAAHGGR